MRLDEYVSQLKSITRSQAQNLIKHELVKVDHKTIKKNGFLLSGKETIEIREIPIKQYHAIANKMELDVIYEDSNVIVINKDRGVQVYPGAEGDMTGTLLSGLRHRYASGENKISIETIGFAHRIDKDTSGLIIIAKNNETLSYLQKQFAERLVTKKYLAFVNGKPEALGKIISPIGRSLKDRKKMSISKAGKDAESDFDLIEYFNDLGISLICIKIYTGRTHQIRVHMASIGHPVIGDELYGSNKVNELFNNKYGIQGQLLHSYKLGIQIPNKGLTTFVAPPKLQQSKLGIDLKPYLLEL